MNIGFVSIFDEEDHKAWSGLVKSMYDNLKLHYPNMISIKGLNVANSKKNVFKKVLNKFFLNKYIEIYRDESVLKDFGIQIDHFILKNNIELIFAPGSFHLAFVNSKIKKIIFIDATFQNLLGSSDWYKNYSKNEIDYLNQIEKNVFDKCDNVICATNWAEESLLNFYKIEQARIKVIPFGANISFDTNVNKIEILKLKKFEQLNLMFIGVDYKRKGLEKVLETVKIINEIHKVKCKLIIIGSNPKIESKFKEFVTVYGFLDKKDKKQFDLFEKLMFESHFLFMPSISEAFGLVYAEASYYGVPSIGHKIDGAQYVIRDGINGYTLPKESTPNDFAKIILEYFEEKKYKSLAKSTLKEYNENLNWENSFKKVKEIIDAI